MLNVPSLGKLSEDASVPEWIVSEPISVPLLHGAQLSFIVETDAIGNERAIGEVEAAVRSFLLLDEADRQIAAARAFDNYSAFIEATDVEELSVPTPNHIWNFIHPSAVRVSRRHRRDYDIYISLDCECSWEVEHGLQFVYRSGHQLVRVSDQDGHLTNADAFDRDDLEIGV